MRLKLDENQPRAALAIFRAAGHDVETAVDEGLAGHSDADLAAHCRREHRTLLTFDLDFADLQQYPPEAYAGLLVLRLRSHAVAHVLHTMKRIAPLLHSEAVEGHLWLIDEVQVRIR
jgi:predicted nuclease of predicted toxin-antitoxin system